MDISKFASNLDSLGGAALTNRYLVSINPPKKITSNSAQEKLSMLCEAQVLPGVAIGTYDRSTPYGYGPNYKMPWGVVFSDINLAFIGDSKGFVHNFFTSWLNLIVNFNTDSVTKIGASSVPFFVNYRDDYATIVNIQALDITNKKIISYKLFDAYPTVIDDIQGAWSDNNRYMRIGVRLNYSRWTVEYEHLNDVETNKLSQINLNSSINNLTQAQADDLNNLTGNIIQAGTKPRYIEYVQTYRNLIPFLPTTDYNL